MSVAAHPEAFPGRRPGMPTWLLTALALILLIGVATAGVVIGRDTAAEEPLTAAAVPPSQLADGRTVETIDGMLLAWTNGDGEEVATYFTDAAVITGLPQSWDADGKLEGTAEISALADVSAGVIMERQGPVFLDREGGLVSHSYRGMTSSGFVTYEISPYDGRISRMWVIGA